jgi:cytochrome c peroxidase
MRLPHAFARFAAAALFLAALEAGCQKAERYGPRPGVEPNRGAEAEPDKSRDTGAQPLDPEIQWIDILNPSKPDVLIDFVHAEKEPEEWAKLPAFWNAPALAKAGQAAAVVGMPPLTAGVVAGGGSASVIKIKVPLGLPDPREYVPASNPISLSKWELGRRLFFDDSWLEAKSGTSCASCHRPDHGFADGVRVHPDSFNTPTLVNCVFNRTQFWDGRAGRLEEVVQRTLEDERESSPSRSFRHVWGGVIHRLRNKPNYHMLFNEVFGTPASEEDGKEKANITQDTLGRALATYLRTILAGDSIHDRALQIRDKKHSPSLKAEHYEAVLDDDALATLGREKAKKTDVAAELMRGYLLFYNLDESRPLMHCYRCHSGRTFTDNQFHNLGVGFPSRPGQEAGRFAQAPIGQKDRTLIDAYKTPTLRNLPRTGPYFHDGKMSTLREAVEFYNLGARRNNYLDPELLGKGGRTRLLDLNEADINALTLFLAGLGGGEVDPVVKTPPLAGR